MSAAWRLRSITQLSTQVKTTGCQEPYKGQEKEKMQSEEKKGKI